MQSPDHEQPDVGVALTVHAITRLAEGAGWPTRQAFRIAMLMVVEGTTVAQAERLFAGAAQRPQ